MAVGGIARLRAAGLRLAALGGHVEEWGAGCMVRMDDLGGTDPLCPGLLVVLSGVWWQLLPRHVCAVPAQGVQTSCPSPTAAQAPQSSLRHHGSPQGYGAFPLTPVASSPLLCLVSLREPPRSPACSLRTSKRSLRHVQVSATLGAFLMAFSEHSGWWLFLGGCGTEMGGVAERDAWQKDDAVGVEGEFSHSMVLQFFGIRQII